MPLPKKSVDYLKLAVDAIPNKTPGLLRDLLSSDALEAVKKNKMANVETKKTKMEIFYNFFGMNKNWNLKRNVLGLFMVHCPEYPTYFIPAFTQAKETGNAKDLKKGEGPRGVITGGLEGVAVGALVSGEFLKPQEMVPYILLGAGLQFISSKIFPWLGEKTGQIIYRRNIFNNLITNGLGGANLQENKQIQVTPISKPKDSNANFTSRYPYNRILTGNLKI